VIATNHLEVIRLLSALNAFLLITSNTDLSQKSIMVLEKVDNIRNNIIVLCHAKELLETTFKFTLQKKVSSAEKVLRGGKMQRVTLRSFQSCT
jgi:hypothetical protein